MRKNFRWHINDEMMWLLKGDMYIKKFMFGDCKKECGGHIFCFVWLKIQVLILAFIVGRFSSLHPWESSIISNWLSVISDSLWLHGLQPARLLCPWNSPGKNTGVVKLMFIESEMPSNNLILCRPLLLLSSIFPGIRVFSNESAVCIRCLSFHGEHGRR